MKRILLLILMLLIFCPLGFGEELPPWGCGYSVTKETNPIYWGYMEDYAAQLKKALEVKRMFRLRGMGTDYTYYITRDGKIENMRVSIPQCKYFDKKIQEVILSVPPEPFPEGINAEKMLFSTYLGYESYEEVSLSVGGHWINGGTKAEDVFSVTVITNK